MLMLELEGSTSTTELIRNKDNEICLETLNCFDETTKTKRQRFCLTHQWVGTLWVGLSLVLWRKLKNSRLLAELAKKLRLPNRSCLLSFFHVFLYLQVSRPVIILTTLLGQPLLIHTFPILLG